LTNFANSLNFFCQILDITKLEKIMPDLFYTSTSYFHLNERQLSLFITGVSTGTDWPFVSELLLSWLLKFPCTTPPTKCTHCKLYNPRKLAIQSIWEVSQTSNCSTNYLLYYIYIAISISSKSFPVPVLFLHKHLLWFLDVCSKEVQVQGMCLLEEFRFWDVWKGIGTFSWNIIKHLIQIFSNLNTTTWDLSWFLCNAIFITKPSSSFIELANVKHNNICIHMSWSENIRGLWSHEISEIII
jgi:hypothetical protein